jgi:hypothetical protein
MDFSCPQNLSKGEVIESCSIAYRIPWITDVAHLCDNNGYIFCISDNIISTKWC